MDSKFKLLPSFFINGVEVLTLIAVNTENEISIRIGYRFINSRFIVNYEGFY